MFVTCLVVTTFVSSYVMLVWLGCLRCLLFVDCFICFGEFGFVCFGGFMICVWICLLWWIWLDLRFVYDVC